MQSAPSALDQGMQEASRLADEGAWDDAFRVLLDLEPDYATDATLLCMMGVVAREADARGVAYDYFRRALAEQPQDPEVLVALGSGLAHYDDPDAESVLRLAAVTAPQLATARLHYGAYLAREGLFDTALQELRAAEQLDPDDPGAARELGVALILSGAVAEGAEALDRASTLAGDDAEMRLLYGLALLAAKRLEEAAEELHRAAAELPEDGEAQVLAALACGAQGWADEAWSALSRAEIAAFTPDPEVVREAEEALEAGDEAAEEMLLQSIAPPMLHERLHERL